MYSENDRLAEGENYSAAAAQDEAWQTPFRLGSAELTRKSSPALFSKSKEWAPIKTNEP